MKEVVHPDLLSRVEAGRRAGVPGRIAAYGDDVVQASLLQGEDRREDFGRRSRRPGLVGVFGVQDGPGGVFKEDGRPGRNVRPVFVVRQPHDVDLGFDGKPHLQGGRRVDAKGRWIPPPAHAKTRIVAVKAVAARIRA